MTAALDVAQRTALSNLIQKARSLLEVDLALTLEGDYGIHRSDGRIEEGGALALDASQAAVRIDLLDIVAFLRSEGETEPAAVERLIREAAFTHVNRLVALRVAEGLGILPEAIGNGLASQGFRDFAEIAPASADEEWERFRLFVRICADELSADVPALFDPRNPLLELEPSTAAFSELIESFVAADKTIWSAPDALGWSYQFFNSAEERKEMRESSAPRNSRELAVRNQFFTPSYVVEFLVQNGLGAHLAASFPALADELPLLVEVPESRAEPIDLREVSALDPACGSGHFLLGAYDVLEAAWRHAGVQPDEAAPDIVRSLWGIDIDPRATQIAQAAVILRARRHCRTPLPKPNVICARSLPATPEADDLIATLPPHVGRVVRAIADELVLAPVLGPLLKIEERLDREARDAFGTGQIEGTLSEGVPEDHAANVESLVLDALASIADQTTSTASQRLFAAEAHDAVRFVEAMSRRYTACLMNPPFGEPVPSTKGYLKSAYTGSEKDIAFAFVGRGVALAAGGSCAAITTRAGFFLQTFEKWRTKVLLRSGLSVLADLGEGVMEQALVESAAFVCSPAGLSDGKATFVRLLRDIDKDDALRDSVRRAREGREDVRVFRLDVEDLGAVPGSPIAYWLPDRFRRLFQDSGEVASIADVKHGLSTGDDFRFVRIRHEVEPNSLGSARGMRPGERWAPFAKGGAYAPFWGESTLVVDWSDGGTLIGDSPGSAIRNPSFYFRPGLTWTRRTASKFAPRLFFGGVFSEKGDLILPRDPELMMPLLGWLNTRTVAALINSMVAAGDETSSGGAARSYEMGRVKLLPCPVEVFPDELGEAATGVALNRVTLDLFDETTTHYAGPWLPGESLREAALARARWLDELAVRSTEKWAEAELATEAALGFDGEDLAYLSGETWPLPTEYTSSPAENAAARVIDYYERPIADVISDLLAEGMARTAIVSLCFTGSRRLEVLAHGLRVSPRAIARIASEQELLPHGLLTETARELMSYLWGVCFGRWTNRVSPVFDPKPTELAQKSLAAEPEISPVADSIGTTQRPSLLIDQPGHPLDVQEALLSAAVHRLGGNELLQDALTALTARPSLARYIRSQFFSDHVSRYTVGRRKAPLYWPLQVPSKRWGVWLYMPRLSREVLFAIVRESEQRQRLAEQRIATLQREYGDGGAGRTIAAVSKELDAEQKLSVELAAFRKEAERIANLGWEPDLDDGAVLNAAPLASLFPAWKDAAKYRKELKQGKHTWSTVSKYADQL